MPATPIRANETGPPCSSHLRQAVRCRLHLFHVMLGLGDDPRWAIASSNVNSLLPSSSTLGSAKR